MQYENMRGLTSSASLFEHDALGMAAIIENRRRVSSKSN